MLAVSMVIRSLLTSRLALFVEAIPSVCFSSHLLDRNSLKPKSHLKVLLSVGGGTYSQDGHFSFLTNSDLRGGFVASAVQLVKDYGFDGM